MTSPKCRHCDKPSPYAELCAACVKTLRIGLRNVAALYADLDTTVRAGTTRYSDTSDTGGRSKAIDARLPFNASFAPRWVSEDGKPLTGDAVPAGARYEHSPVTVFDYEIRNTLATWCRAVIAEHPPLPLPPRLIVCSSPTCPRCIPLALTGHDAKLQDYRRRKAPTDTITSMSVYLFRMAGAIAQQPYSGELLDDVLHLERRLRRFVDRPGDTWYAGVCGSILEQERPHDVRSCACQCHHGLGVACDVPGGCGRELATIDAVLCSRPLWAKADEREVRCRDCGTTWAVDDRREILLAEARERVLTVDAIWKIVHQLVDDTIGYPQFAARVRQWKHRGKISPVTTKVVEAEQRPAYLVSDVLDLLAKPESEAS